MVQFTQVYLYIITQIIFYHKSSLFSIGKQHKNHKNPKISGELQRKQKKTAPEGGGKFFGSLLENVLYLVEEAGASGVILLVKGSFERLECVLLLLVEICGYFHGNLYQLIAAAVALAVLNALAADREYLSGLSSGRYRVLH